MSDQEVWLTTDMASVVIKRCAATVRQRCNNGYYPNAYRSTVGWRIPMSDIEAAQPPEGVTIYEGMELTGMSDTWLAKLCHSGKVSAVRWRRKWYMNRDDLEAYVAKRKDRHDIRYDILRDRDRVWECYAANGYSFKRAAEVCTCSISTFSEYFHKAGLNSKGKTPRPVNGNRLTPVVWAKLLENAYAKVNGIPAKCPKNCPGWLADKDCLTEGMECIFG